MVFAWNRREIIIYDEDDEIIVVSETSALAMGTAVNALLQMGWTIDPVLSQLSTVLRGATLTFSIILVREIPTP